ncbi:MAG: hypothetical protein NDI61_02840 [Bdellovibrionaceae bacterium]|nr:hypothetical protein [Pseudobdellovibrionaceae bacterium]
MSFVYLYLFLLMGHLLYAWLALRSRQFSLVIFRAQKPASVLMLLLLINGFSLLAFAYARPWWALLHMFLHAALGTNEARHLKSTPARWPFLVNHLGFIWVLYLYFGTTTSAS